MAYIIAVASGLIGASVGLISASIFAVILRRIENNNPSRAVGELTALIGIILSGGAADYVLFDIILQTGGIMFYMIGFSIIFLPLGLLVYKSWMGKHD